MNSISNYFVIHRFIPLQYDAFLCRFRMILVCQFPFFIRSDSLEAMPYWYRSSRFSSPYSSRSCPQFLGELIYRFYPFIVVVVILLPFLFFLLIIFLYFFLSYNSTSPKVPIKVLHFYSLTSSLLFSLFLKFIPLHIPCHHGNDYGWQLS